MIKISSIWMFIVLLLCAVPLQASDSTNVVPHTQNDHNDLDMYGQNIVNVGGVNTGNVTLTQVYTVGDPCEEGQLGRDDGGEILACKSGSWAKAQSGGGFFGGSFVDGQLKNPFTNWYSCPSGFMRVTMFQASTFTSDPDHSTTDIIGCYAATCVDVPRNSSCPSGYNSVEKITLTSKTCCKLKPI